MAQVGGAKSQKEEFKRKQVVLVPDGTYIGMLAGYSMPKAYKEFDGDGIEWKMFTWFTLTHDRTNTQLPQFSGALFPIKCILPEGSEVGAPKYYYNAEKNLISAYVAFLYAMKGGTMSKQEIFDAAEDYDLDEFISKPAILFVKQGKPNPETKLVTQKVKEIQPADLATKKAVLSLYENRKIGYTDEQHLGFLEYPAPSFVGDAVNPGTVTSSEVEEEMPF